MNLKEKPLNQRKLATEEAYREIVNKWISYKKDRFRPTLNEFCSIHALNPKRARRAMKYFEKVNSKAL